MKKKWFLLIFLTVFFNACQSEPRSASELLNQPELPATIVVKLKDRGEQNFTLELMNSGEVGMVYRIQGSEPPEIVKIPFSNQISLFDAEVRMLTDPIITDTLGDMLVKTNVDYITEVDQEPRNLKVLVKEEVLGKPLLSLDFTGYRDSFTNLFHRLKELARDHNYILEDLHEENIMITEQEPRQLKIIDGTARRAASGDSAHSQFIESCNDWSWCRKFALNQVRSLPASQKCSSLAALFSFVD